MAEKIRAVQWAYGFTVTEAKRFIKKADKILINLLVEGFKANAKRNFYED